MNRICFCTCLLILQAGVAAASEPRLTAEQARAAAQYVMANHDDGSNRAVAETNARIKQLLNSRPVSTPAIKTILVPGFSQYVRSKYRDGGNLSQGRVTRLVNWLREFGEDARDSVPTLEEVRKNARLAALARAATAAINAIQRRSVVGTITAADPTARRITLTSKGKNWNLVVPADVRIDGQTLRGLVEVTFDDKTKRVFTVKPIEF